MSEDEVYKYLKPYIHENIELNKRIENLKERLVRMEGWVEDRDRQISKLTRHHEDSGLKRDEPMKARWQKKVYQHPDAGRMEQHIFWFCPVCEKMISNWEPYCCMCGQRIGDRDFDPEMEVKDGKETDA